VSVGVDGFRGGWVVATPDAVRAISSLGPLVANATIDLIGIDMVIGLPEAWGRRADAEARRVLGTRSATVFSAPPRQLIDETDYATANARSRALFGRGLPKQTFHLLARIREVDALVDDAGPDRLVEVHPECAFAAMAGHPLSPKRTPAGVRERRALLEPIYGDVTEIRLRGARVDDILDAFAVLWSAERFARGVHATLGCGPDGSVERDRRGRPMRIVM
jgi:predicted RNase H-like nuclease